MASWQVASPTFWITAGWVAFHWTALTLPWAWEAFCGFLTLPWAWEVLCCFLALNRSKPQAHHPHDCGLLVLQLGHCQDWRGARRSGGL